MVSSENLDAEDFQASISCYSRQSNRQFVPGIFLNALHVVNQDNQIARGSRGDPESMTFMLEDHVVLVLHRMPELTLKIVVSAYIISLGLAVLVLA